MRVGDRGALGGRKTRALPFALAILCIACNGADPLEEVRSLQDEGNWQESVALLRELVDASPEDPSLHLAHGKALLAVGESTRAIWPLRKAVESEDFAVPAGVLLARALLASGNSEDAVRAASEVLVRDPHNRSSLLFRGRAQLAAKREELALEDADRLIELDWGDIDAQLLRLTALLTLDREMDAEESIAELRAQLDDRDRIDLSADARFCALEAVFTWERGQRGAGEERVEQCLREFPDQPVVVAQAVSLFDRGDDLQRANSVLRSALEIDPANPDIRFTLAQRLRAQADPQAAEELLREGTAVLEGYLPWQALHEHYVIQEDYVKARDAMEQVLNLHPDPPVLFRLAYADDLVLVGDLEAAEASAETLPAPASHFLRGRIHLERDEPAEALAEFELGLPLWPDNPTARWLAGGAAERIGDFSNAIAHYRESVRSDASRTDAALELAELYAQMGAARDALDFAMRHLQSHPGDEEAAIVLIQISRRFGSEMGRTMGLRALSNIPEARDRATAERAIERAMQEGHEAGIAYLESLPESPERQGIEVLRALTRLRLEVGQSDEALSKLRSALAAEPGSVDLHLLMAEAQAATGAPRAERRRSLERARELAPQHSAALLGLAQIAVEEGRRVEAIELYDHVPGDAPEAADARLASLELSAQAPDAEAAKIERRLEGIVAAYPRNGTAALGLARRIADRDRGSERALALARRAVLLDGGLDAIEVLGRILVEGGDASGAIEVLRAVVSSSPQRASAYYWLGRALEAKGELASALEALRQALELAGLSDEQRQEATAAIARLGAIDTSMDETF